MQQQISDQINKIFSDILVSKDPLEKAHLIKKLHLEYQIKIKDIANHLSTKSANISNLIRITQLPDLVLDGYYSDVISLTHLQIISRLNNAGDIIDVYEKVIQHDASTQLTEKFVFEKLYNNKPEGIKVNQEIIKRLLDTIKQIHPEYHAKLVQTQRKATLTVTIKGNRKKTTPFLEKLIEKIISE